MEGTIKRIKLQNFVTYDAVECIPCENLNVIIGPNGTGKSTIVSAIMLGLGEKPTLTGRGKKVQEFIQTGHQEAKIILELHPDYKVERTITADGKSVYKLNTKIVSEKEINNFTKQLNIQVGNLCQFLPQDRVSEFARMNKKELLINTEKAVGGDELVNLHNELITMQSRSQNEGNDLAAMENSLANKRERNARLDVDITTITEKNNLLLEIGNCKKKLLWVQYEDARKEVADAKAECAPKEGEMQKAKTDFEPIRRQKQALERKYLEIKEKKKNMSKAYDTLEAKLKSKMEEVHDALAQVKTLENNDKRNSSRDERRTEQIQTLKVSIEDQNKTIAEMEAGLPDRKRQIEDIKAELDEYGRRIAALDQQIAQVKYEANQFKYEKEALRSSITRIENVQSQKLELLRRVNPDAFKGVEWLEANRHMFKGTVYLPLMVVLNVTDPRCASYVENAIGYRDLVAFSCERRDDQNLLTNQLRTNRGWAVNIFSTDIDKKPIREQRVSPEEIRRYGFDGYLDQYITAPEPVKKYLRASSSLHVIPVSHRPISLDASLPPSIRKYYTDGSVTMISGSSYCNELITMVSSVRPATCLQISQNVTNLDVEKNRLREIEETLTQSMSKVTDLTRQKDKINESSAQKREERNRLGRAEADLQTAKHARRRKEQELQDLERERQEFVTERNNLQKRIEGLIKDSVNKQASLAALYENAHVVNQVKMSKLEHLKAANDCKKVDRAYKAKERSVEDAEAAYERAKANHRAKIEDAKRIFAEAKKETEGVSPKDEGFRKFQEIFNTFPSTVEELQALIDEKGALVACKKNVDNSILVEYQTRAREIDQLEKNIRKKEEEISSFKNRMTRTKEDWLQRLGVLVDKISANFQKYYKEIECVGDVVLEPGNEEHDYKNYGLSIKVSYRQSVPLKELDQFVQSGGERAVATALYMISLQELTKVPFRCVDEINQGMDEINERRVYKLLMSITSNKDTSQYFLLTPKLLKDIEYSDSCMVHCVFNGPNVLSYKHWNIDSFINRKKRRMDTE